MTDRVCYRPAGENVAVALAELGHDAGGAWGLVDDVAWAASPNPGALELLYLSRADYEHAVRRLPPAEVARAIRHRRETFSAKFVERASGHLQEAIWAALDRTDQSEAGTHLRARLLAVHARFIDIESLRHERPADRLAQLVHDDRELYGNLDSPSLQAAAREDTDGKERELRRRFAEELSVFLPPAQREAFWPYFEAERVYAIRPAFRCSRDDGPCPRWRDAVVMALGEREAVEQRATGHALDLVYGAKGELIEADYLLTEAQLDIEIEERVKSPDPVRRLQIDRFAVASAREATRTLSVGQRKLVAVLAGQTKEELRGLGTWGRRPGLVKSPAAAKEAVGAAASLAHLAAVLLMRRKELLWLSAKQKAMAKALAEIAKEP